MGKIRVEIEWEGNHEKLTPSIIESVLNHYADTTIYLKRIFVTPLPKQEAEHIHKFHPTTMFGKEIGEQCGCGMYKLKPKQEAEFPEKFTIVHGLQDTGIINKINEILDYLKSREKGLTNAKD